MGWKLRLVVHSPKSRLGPNGPGFWFRPSPKGGFFMKLNKLLVSGVLLATAGALQAADTTDSTGVPINGGATVTNPGVGSAESLGERPGPSQVPGLDAQSGAIYMEEFPSVDANRDGYIDRQEAAQHRELSDSFSELDENND